VPLGINGLLDRTLELLEADNYSLASTSQSMILIHHLHIPLLFRELLTDDESYFRYFFIRIEISGPT